eukprot:3342077-Amphidinium_carterae.2
MLYFSGWGYPASQLKQLLNFRSLGVGNGCGEPFGISSTEQKQEMKQPLHSTPARKFYILNSTEV